MKTDAHAEKCGDYLLSLAINSQLKEQFAPQTQRTGFELNAVQWAGEVQSRKPQDSVVPGAQTRQSTQNKSGLGKPRAPRVSTSWNPRRRLLAFPWKPTGRGSGVCCCSYFSVASFICQETLCKICLLANPPIDFCLLESQRAAAFGVRAAWGAHVRAAEGEI